MPDPAVRLEPMTETEYAAYRERAEDSYAEGIHRSGAMSLADARAKAAEDYARLLPDGLATAGQRLWTAFDGSEPVGVLWLGFTDTDEGLTAFGFDFEVREDLRRHGYGRAMMLAAEGPAAISAWCGWVSPSSATTSARRRSTSRWASRSRPSR